MDEEPAYVCNRCHNIYCAYHAGMATDGLTATRFARWERYWDFSSVFSLFRITINESKCNRCGLCSRKCKAACIDGKEHRIDHSRCVACMDCIDTCKHGAVGFRMRTKASDKKTGKEEKQKADNSQIDTARRSFLSATAVLAATCRKRKWTADWRLSRTRRFRYVPRRLYRRVHGAHVILHSIVRSASFVCRPAPTTYSVLRPTCRN